MIAEVDPSTNLVHHIHFPGRLAAMSDYTDTSFWDDVDVQWDIPNFVVANNGVLYVMPKYPEEFNDHGVIAFSHPSFCPENGYGVKHRRLGYNFCCPELSRLDANGINCTCSNNSEIDLNIQGNQTCTCSSGYEKDSNRTCTACKLGSYKFGRGPQQCIACNFGTYTNTTASIIMYRM